MGIAVLGPLEVGGEASTLGLRDRVVLEALAVHSGSVVSPDALAEAIWGDAPPASSTKVVQGCIVRLRKALGAEAIETTPRGYRLRVHVDHLDNLRFEHLIGRARELLALGEPERAVYVLDEALALWRGDPFTDLAEWGPGRIELDRLVELRDDAEDLRIEALLRCGRYQEALPAAVRLVQEAPFRERRWGLLALAQYQGGRQRDALETLHRARTVMVKELGLDPGPDLTSLEQAILRQDPSLAVSTALPPPSPICPYLGLVAYDISDAGAFFGRTADTTACLDRLDSAGTLAIVGPSGCGKSSLARAGVAAALERDGARVRVVVPGGRPMDSLTAAPGGARSVLVVDQCEEALAPEVTEEERAAFFSALALFANSGRLILTFRADRLGDISAHPAFAHVVERGLYLLGPMRSDDLRSAIEGPADQAGLRLEPGLVDLLLREVEGAPGALPLVSHVMRQTWARREGSTLTVAGYRATGGVREAVSQSAENLFRGLTSGQQDMVRDLMLRLVVSDDSGEPVRTRAPRRSVAPDDEHAAIIEKLLGARLLSSDGDTVEIAHESLAAAWPRLRSWLDDDVEGLRIMRHLSVAADSWDELGRPDSELYRGARQSRAAQWRSQRAPDLVPVEEDFLDASAALMEAEARATEDQVRRERRTNRRLRAGLVAVAGLLAVALVAGLLARTSAKRADAAAARAAHEALAADARRLGAEALRTEDLDRSLLLAAAGMSLDDTVDTRTNLLATLDRAPALVGGARSAGRIFHSTVNATTDQVAVMAADGVGLELYDASTLRRLPLPEKLVGGTVVARPDGQGFAVSMSGDLVESGQEPPVLLLDRTGARSAVQLGGIPPGYHVLDLGFPRRWYLGYSPTGRWLTVSLAHIHGEKPTLTLVWDLRSPRRPAATLELGHVGSAPTLSPDGRTLYSAEYGPRDAPGHLLVTDLPSGTVRRTLTAADLGVQDLDDVLALSPDGRTLAVGAGTEALLVDTSTLTPKAHLSGQRTTQAIAFSPDGSRLAATGDRLMVWDISGQEPVELLTQDGEVDDPQFSRDGNTLYTNTIAGLVQAWDIVGDRRFIPSRAGEHLDWPDPLGRFSPDRSNIAYVANGPKFRVRDVASGTLGPVIAPKMAQGAYLDIAWHPDSTTLNITSGDPWVRTWDSTTGRQLAERRLAPAPSTEAAAIAFFSLDGRYLLVGTTAGRLHVLDAHTLVPAHEPIEVYQKAGGEPDPQDVDNFAPSGDLRTVYLNDAIVDYVAGSVRQMPDLGFPVVDLYPSPDGKRLIVGTGPTGVGLLDADTMNWISRPNAAQTGLLGYLTAWSKDGSLVASVHDGRLSQWDGRTGTYLGTVGVPLQADPAFSDDNKWLLVAGDDGSVLSWDLDPQSWIATACRLAGRGLTEQEWRNYLPKRTFEPICASQGAANPPAQDR